MRPLYHLLDPFWQRFPFPAGHNFERTTFQDATVLRMCRTYFGSEMLPVFCYVVGDAIVDTGLSSVANEVGEVARAAKVERALLTHHHEDHAGNAALLARQGARVLASEPGVAIVAHTLPRRFYQHLLWGEAEGVAAEPVAGTVPLGRLQAQVIPATGHSKDQLAYLVPERGWLFSGDAFVAERIKVFRGDEDFQETVATLRRFLTLDFDALLCAHRPRFSGGKEAIRGKLEWLLELEGTVCRLHEEGRSVRSIVKHLGLTTSSRLYALTFGDVNTANLVRAILFGPRPRVEVAAALARARPNPALPRT